MRRNSLISLLAAPLLLASVCNAEPTRIQTGAARFDDHPTNILEHYRWCLAAKTLNIQTIRLRDFWEDHRPIEGEYEDSIHGRMVLLSAYKLAENYSRMKRPDDAVLFLNWIKSEDNRLIEEERKPAK